MTIRSPSDTGSVRAVGGAGRDAIASRPVTEPQALPPGGDAECRYCGWREQDGVSGEHLTVLHRALLKDEAEVARLTSELRKLVVYTKEQQDRTIDQIVRAQKAENERDAALAEAKRWKEERNLLHTEAHALRVQVQQRCAEVERLLKQNFDRWENRSSNVEAQQ